MKTFLKLNLILTILLSIATGVFKILQQPADIALFEQIGFDVTATTILGIIQLIGGLLMLFSQSRKWGAYLMIPTFVIASIAVFANGMIAFGWVSLIFIIMAILVAFSDRIKK